MDRDAFAEAVSDQPAADDRQEAPASSAASGFDEWDSQAQEQPEQQAPPPGPNWDDPTNPYREQALAAAEERDRLRQQANQLAYAQAVEAWNRAEIEHQQRTSGMDAYEARQVDREFYKNREAGLISAYNQLQGQTQQYQHYVTVQQQAQHLVSQHQLDADDAESLMAIGALDPTRMQIEAKRRADLAKKNRELERRIARLETGEDREERLASGADRFGGRGGSPAPRREFTGSDQELAAILKRDGVLDALSRGR